VPSLWVGAVIAALLALLAIAAPEPIRLTVSPRLGFAPSDMHLKIIIERDVRNRALAIVIDGDRYYRRRVIEVDGDQRQRVWDEWFMDLPCGLYVVRVTVVRTDGEHPARGESEIRGSQCPELEAQP
jgi:hypothetical protein